MLPTYLSTYLYLTHRRLEDEPTISLLMLVLIYCARALSLSLSLSPSPSPSPSPAFYLAILVWTDGWGVNFLGI
jgi:hypothetical protein